MQRVRFSQTEWTDNLALRLDWAASPSCELTEWPNWTFCPILQLAWLFSSSAYFTRVHPLATCKPRDPVASPLLSAQSWAILHTLLHTTLTWFPPKYRVSKCWITSKLARIKPTKCLIKFNLTNLLVYLIQQLLIGHVTMILIKNVKYNKIKFTTLSFPIKMTPNKFSLQWLQAGKKKKKTLYFTGEKNQLHGSRYIILVVNPYNARENYCV